MSKEDLTKAAWEYVKKSHSVADNYFQNAMNIACAKAFVAGAEYKKTTEQQYEEEKKHWIDKVCEFLEQRNILEKDCSILASGICSITFHPDNLINDLKQAMIEE